MFNPLSIISNWLISLLSLHFLTKTLFENIFSMGVKIRSDNECPTPLKCWPTGSLVSAWHSWVIESRWPQNLASAVFPVSPKYWGRLGQVLFSFPQVPMYRRLLLVHVSFPPIGRSSPVLLILIELSTSPIRWFVYGHSLHFALPQRRNPLSTGLNCLSGGSRARTSSSRTFFPRL